MDFEGWTTYASIFIKKLNTVQMEKENRLHKTLMFDDQHILPGSKKQSMAPSS